MPDPVDWGLVLESPIFWGAVLTLLGVLTGHWWAARAKRGDTELAGLKASVEVLQAEYKRVSTEVKELRGEIRDLRSENDNTERARRMIQEKYSVSLSVLGSLKAGFALVKVRAEREGFDLPDFPVLPEPIRLDFEQMTPDID